MADFLTDFYKWILAGHIIFVIFWMAALYYLPRLFVYHARVDDMKQAALLAEMERRLLHIIATPSMCGAWGFGLLLLFVPGIVDWGAWWMWLKLAFVLGLSFYHLACMRWQRAFWAGRQPHDERFYRLINEVGPVMTIFIVILVVLKPF